MKRPQLNFLIDAASFVAFLLLVSTGLVLRYQLPPGSGGLDKHGTGQAAASRLVTFLWGGSRHDWGQPRGSSTLAEAAAESGVSVQNLRDQLGLADDASLDERIGPLLRESGKRMSDLRRSVESRAELDAPNEKEAKA